MTRGMIDASIVTTFVATSIGPGGIAVRTIGVRELKERTSEVLRRVRQRGEEIEVTHRGRVVARLVPVSSKPPSARAASTAWTTLDRVAREIGQRWPKGKSATDTVREGRRDL